MNLLKLLHICPSQHVHKCSLQQKLMKQNKSKSNKHTDNETRNQPKVCQYWRGLWSSHTIVHNTALYMNERELHLLT